MNQENQPRTPDNFDEPNSTRPQMMVDQKIGSVTDEGKVIGVEVRADKVVIGTGREEAPARPSQQKGVPWVWIMVGIAALVIIGFLLSGGFPDGGPTVVYTTEVKPVSVPYVIQMAEDEAKRALEQKGLYARVEGSDCRDDTGPGLVIATRPEANVWVDPGSTVYLTLSSGPCNVVNVPDVAGMALAQAEEELEKWGLNPGSEPAKTSADCSDLIDQDLVIRSDPGAGELADQGSWVTLVISNGKCSAEAGAPTPDGGGSGKIAFVSWTLGGIDYEIYLINSDGTDLKRITNNELPDDSPSWSPDGGRLAFISGWTPEIWLMNSDGTGQERLTDKILSDFGSFEGAINPSWSPQGYRLAFVFEQDRISDIFTVNIDGSGVEKITDGMQVSSYLAWSPDGTKIAFVSRNEERPGLYIINADGSGLMKIVNDTDNSNIRLGNQAWSPDGKKIAFSMGISGIYVTNLDNDELVQLTHTESWWPAWSPDGAQMVYISRQDSSHGEVYVMNADGSNPRRLTTNQSTESVPVWQPPP